MSGPARKVRSVFERIQPMDSDPMLNFDERDLFDLAIAGGNQLFAHGQELMPHRAMNKR